MKKRIVAVVEARRNDLKIFEDEKKDSFIEASIRDFEAGIVLVKTYFKNIAVFP